MPYTEWGDLLSSFPNQNEESTMDKKRLHKIIRKFAENEPNEYIYKFGLCSEFAVALKRFLKGGTISKAGLTHTYLKWKNHYCDITGCLNKEEFQFRNPSTSLSPATKAEIAHINKLLEHKEVDRIYEGLKKAARQVK